MNVVTREVLLCVECIDVYGRVPIKRVRAGTEGAIGDEQ